MAYWKVKKMSLESAAFELKRALPQLKKVFSDEIVDHLQGTGLEFRKAEKAKTPVLVRLTLPFALIAFVLFLVLLPVKYIFTGKWYYEWNWLENWFKSLGFGG